MREKYANNTGIMNRRWGGGTFIDELSDGLCHVCGVGRWH